MQQKNNLSIKFLKYDVLDGHVDYTMTISDVGAKISWV